MPTCEELYTRSEGEALEQRVSNVESELKNLEEALERLKEQVEENREDIAINRQEIEKVEEKVTEVAGDLSEHIALGSDVAHGGFKVESVSVEVSGAGNSADGTIKLFVRVDVDGVSDNGSASFSFGGNGMADCCDEIRRLIRELQDDAKDNGNKSDKTGDRIIREISDLRDEIRNVSNDMPSGEDFEDLGEKVEDLKDNIEQDTKDTNDTVEKIDKTLDKEIERILSALLVIQNGLGNIFDEAKAANLNTQLSDTYDKVNIQGETITYDPVAVSSLEQALNVINYNSAYSGGQGGSAADSPTILKIFKILGGDFWNIGDDGTVSPKPYDPEENLQTQVSANYGDGDRINSKQADIMSLPDLIKSLLGVIYARGGLVDYPITVPDLLTSETDNTTQLQNAHRFQTWQTLQLDALLGRYPIKIKIEDSDLIKVGEQPIEISLPNVAETQAEMMGMLIESKASNDAILSAVLRDLAETGSHRLLGVKSNYLLNAIADYLGFATKQKKVKVPFSFNPINATQGDDTDSIAKALEEKEIDVEIEELKEKVSYQTSLSQLLEAAAIIKARFFKSVPGGAGLKEYLVNAIKAYGNATEEEQSNFDEFLDRLEKGFIDESGISDSINPYGRPFEDRPRVRELGETDD